MNNYEILVRAKQKISNPKNWTQRALSRNVDNKHVHPASVNAVCWCSVGAVYATTQDDELAFAKDGAISFLKEAAFGIDGDDSVTAINDFGTHEEVLNMFDVAIALAESEL